jgi:hypothetical protein
MHVDEKFSVIVKRLGGSLHQAERIRLMSVATSTFSATLNALNFGNQPTGQASAPMVVTVKNTGNVPLHIASIMRSGKNLGQFS